MLRRFSKITLPDERVDEAISFGHLWIALQSCSRMPQHSLRLHGCDIPIGIATVASRPTGQLRNLGEQSTVLDLPSTLTLHFSDDRLPAVGSIARIATQGFLLMYINAFLRYKPSPRFEFFRIVFHI